jgi:glucose/mannose transport system substrate-binding protein
MKKHFILLICMLLLQTLSGNVTAQEEAPTGELEIFSWWAGDEGPALEALIALFIAT